LSPLPVCWKPPPPDVDPHEDAMRNRPAAPKVSKEFRFETIAAIDVVRSRHGASKIDCQANTQTLGINPLEADRRAS
jgi:hypothetical protein